MKRVINRKNIIVLIITLIIMIPVSYCVVCDINFKDNPNAIHHSVYKDYKDYFKYKEEHKQEEAGDRYIHYSQLPVETMIALDCVDIDREFPQSGDDFINSYVDKYYLGATIYDKRDFNKMISSSVTNEINQLFDKYSEEGKSYLYKKVFIFIAIKFLFYFIMVYIIVNSIIKRNREEKTDDGSSIKRSIFRRDM